MHPDYHLRNLQPEDHPAVVALLRAEGQAIDPGHFRHRLSRPGTATTCLLHTPSQTLAGFTAAIPFTYRLRQQATTLHFSVDTVLHPDHRKKGLSKPLFHHIAAQTPNFIGIGVNQNSRPALARAGFLAQTHCRAVRVPRWTWARPASTARPCSLADIPLRQFHQQEGAPLDPDHLAFRYGPDPANRAFALDNGDYAIAVQRGPILFLLEHLSPDTNRRRTGQIPLLKTLFPHFPQANRGVFLLNTHHQSPGRVLRQGTLPRRQPEDYFLNCQDPELLPFLQQLPIHYGWPDWLDW